MKKLNVALWVKTFLVCVVLMAINAAIGGSGYVTLNKVVRGRELNITAERLAAKVLETRSLEKDYLLRRPEWKTPLPKTVIPLEELGDFLTILL